MKIKSATTLFMALAPFAHSSWAEQARPAPVQVELKLIHIFEGAEPTHLFAVGESGFASVESLKGFLGTLPPGSQVKWAPSCTRFGNEPLLSSERDLEEFRHFLERKGISLVLVPSG